MNRIIVNQIIPIFKAEIKNDSQRLAKHPEIKVEICEIELGIFKLRKRILLATINIDQNTF